MVADGVAFAPHLAIDVKAWGVDWYGFSVYKTWGPHMAALYGSHAAFAELKVYDWVVLPLSSYVHEFRCDSNVALPGRQRNKYQVECCDTQQWCICCTVLRLS